MENLLYKSIYQCRIDEDKARGEYEATAALVSLITYSAVERARDLIQKIRNDKIYKHKVKSIVNSLSKSVKNFDKMMYISCGGDKIDFYDEASDKFIQRTKNEENMILIALNNAMLKHHVKHAYEISTLHFISAISTFAKKLCEDVTQKLKKSLYNVNFGWQEKIAEDIRFLAKSLSYEIQKSDGGTIEEIEQCTEVDNIRSTMKAYTRKVLYDNSLYEGL